MRRPRKGRGRTHCSSSHTTDRDRPLLGDLHHSSTDCCHRPTLWQIMRHYYHYAFEVLELCHSSKGVSSCGVHSRNESKHALVGPGQRASEQAQASLDAPRPFSTTTEHKKYFQKIVSTPEARTNALPHLATIGSAADCRGFKLGRIDRCLRRALNPQYLPQAAPRIVSNKHFCWNVCLGGERSQPHAMQSSAGWTPDCLKRGWMLGWVFWAGDWQISGSWRDIGTGESCGLPFCAARL